MRLEIIADNLRDQIPTNLKETKTKKELAICTDAFGVPQGVMLYSVEPEIMKVHWLTSRPENIQRKKTHTHPLGVTGAGTALMSYVEREGQTLHKNMVWLQSALGAKEFYRKLGYTETKANGVPYFFKEIAHPTD